MLLFICTLYCHLLKTVPYGTMKILYKVFNKNSLQSVCGQEQLIILTEVQMWPNKISYG